MFEVNEETALTMRESVVDYVRDKALQWQRYVESNYYSKWDEYNRIWKGQWAEEDKSRSNERSRIVTPATQQAVESATAEVEEATFGVGEYFDLRDDVRDEQNGDIELLRKLLDEEFRKNKIRAQVSQVLMTAAIYGTGIAEVVTEECIYAAPMSRPALDGQVQEIGVNKEKRIKVVLNPVMPKNFYPDPAATSIDSGHGCIIEEFVPKFQVTQLQESGAYMAGDLRSAAPDSDLNPDPELTVNPEGDDKVKLTKYFGLVPRYILDTSKMSGEELEDYYVDDKGESKPLDDTLVESIVILANDGVLLKAEESPYMMEERPVLAFQWDVVPGVFHGRGVVEKGYNSQKALDAEIRARIDALALTVNPMLAMDATRIPRGHKPEVRAGKTILTNGSPKDTLMPFNFGSVSDITFAQAAELQQMVQQSTGAFDVSTMQSAVSGEAKTGAVSMSLGAVIKRQKRTLINFQECFWIPFVRQAAHRYMQFDPQRWPIGDYEFVPSSTLGIMAREYEVAQLVQLLQTMSPESPLYPALVSSIVDNMNLSNREELLGILKQASQPDPEQQAMQQQMHQMDMALKQAQTDFANGQAAESYADAEYKRAQARAVPEDTQIKKLEAITRNLQDGADDDNEFARRLKIAEIALKERELGIKDRQATATQSRMNRMSPTNQGTM